MKWVIPEKTKTGGTYFSEPSWFFSFVFLTLEILVKTQHYPRKFGKIVLHNLNTPRPKTRTLLEILHEYSLEHPWRFYFFFNWPLKFPYAFSSIPLEITRSQWPPSPPLLFEFFLKQPNTWNNLKKPCKIGDEKSLITASL